MESKLRQILIVAILLFATTNGVKAQDGKGNFELANVTYTYCPSNGNSKIIEITTPGGFEKKNVDFHNQQKSEANLVFLFAEISKLQEDGWELITYNSYGGAPYCYATTAFLKRKNNSVKKCLSFSICNNPI